MTTLDRIKILCKERKMNITSLEKECGFSQNSIVKWAKTSPSVDKIICVARYFNVSADYLLCLTDEPKRLENRYIAEHSTTALSTELAQYEELWKDNNFRDTVKLYDGISFEYRSILFGCILGVLQTLKVDTKKILGY